MTKTIDLAELIGTVVYENYLASYNDGSLDKRLVMRTMIVRRFYIKAITNYHCYNDGVLVMSTEVLEEAAVCYNNIG